MRFGQPLSFGEVPHTNPTVVPTQTGKQRSSCHLQTLQLFPRSCGLPEGAWSAEYSIKHDFSAECSIQYLQTLHLFPTTYKAYSCSQRSCKPRLFCTGARGDCLGLPEGAWSAECLIKHDYSTECSIQYLQTLQLFPTAYKPYSCCRAAAASLMLGVQNTR